MTTPPKYLWTREWVTRLRWRNRDREGQQRSGSSAADKLSRDIGSVAHRPVRHRSTRRNRILAAPEGAALSQRYRLRSRQPRKAAAAPHRRAQRRTSAVQWAADPDRQTASARRLRAVKSPAQGDAPPGLKPGVWHRDRKSVV